ncbi:MAG: response regulator [Desulfobacula sp.]|jgi:DNA-binding response OmpR family regulator|uniref:response regulator n=1 Tax=Desulfobacula sp. TaxID=2593537 RepID=UPI001E08DB13|nr:response regulator [Desulfobacula sp.]MBT3486304.1 response regulator [Desulfobacula sp.]MBT3805268.1 response regulator [Desulfobacula sp.]MBT4026115.1 response regulator [Desulfobacula sp.]MBT4198036.1 response regulator [Desulfobacula sp.]
MGQGKKTILIVEDDSILSSLIKEYLEKQDYNISTEPRGDCAAYRILEESPDLVILDLMLPGKDGLSVCRDVRSSYKGPILILTAKEDDMDQVAALEMGADDYVKKPVKPRVLLARIRALFRRAQSSPIVNSSEKIKHFGILEIDSSSRVVRLEKEKISLTTLEFDVLWLLASEPGKILSRDHIFNSVKGFDWDGTDRSIDMAISRLRKKLKDSSENPLKIKTIWGSGYLFVEEAWN